MDDGTVLERHSIYNCMESFINMRNSAWDFPGFRPIRIMRHDGEEWRPLEPDALQIKKCLQIAYRTGR